MTRRDFYHKLLKEGVASGAFKIEAQMNFEMSTQFIKMGALEFSKHRDEIQEELRKKYSKPESSVGASLFDLWQICTHLRRV